jgi:DNA-directed RNA polymerase I, II, and III subunit RPABC1
MSIQSKVAKAHVTLCEMMEDRGTIESEDLRYIQSFGTDEIGALLRQSNGTISIDIKNKILIVYFVTKFRISEFAATMKRTLNMYPLCLVILTDKLTAPNARTIAEHSKKHGCTIQTFLLSELQYNVTRHELVPKHEVISDEAEIEELVTQLQVKHKGQLPVILKLDPVSRYLGVKAGQIMKITRSSPSAGETVFYRVVV